MRAHHPIAEIDGVNVLLHHLVPADPHKRVPVAMLPFHVAPGRIAMVNVQYRSAEIACAESRHLADGAIVDFRHGFDVLLIRTVVGAGHDRQLHFPEFLDGSEEAARSHRIRCDRLFREDVLSGLRPRLQTARVDGREVCTATPRRRPRR